LIVMVAMVALILPGCAGGFRAGSHRKEVEATAPVVPPPPVVPVPVPPAS